MRSKHHTVRQAAMLRASRDEALVPPRKPQHAAQNSSPILRDAHPRDYAEPHPEAAAQRPSRGKGVGLSGMREEIAETDTASQAELPRSIRYDPRRHAEVFRAIADVTGVHVYCRHRACLRAKCCQAPEPPCFVTHAEDFHDFVRKKLGPRFKSAIALQGFTGENAK